MSELRTKCLIIGSGPAGYTAGIYTSRANLEPLMVEGIQPGGQLITTTDVENFPGYIEGVSGPKLMQDLRAQAERYGLNIMSGEVTSVDFSERPYRAKVNGGATEIVADTVIICTGAAAKYLGLPDEQKYMGLGVSACATCDGFFFRGRPVAVVGGGDTACEEALYLANLASKVYMIVRKDYLRASKVMQKRVMENPKIEVLFNTVTLSLFGEEALDGAHVVTSKGTSDEKEYDINVEGFFLGIGHKPNTEIFAGSIELDEAGFIKTVPGSTATNVAGVFAAGDVADPVYQQAVSAAGMGCRAALDAERFIMMSE
ncbi:MAG: thioredoxin-disulfide reductase [Muribaculaceae bacterium]|nr:thioredoxin-disulfide reductase [Muribaculaceae bacterium]